MIAQTFLTRTPNTIYTQKGEYNKNLSFFYFKNPLCTCCVAPCFFKFYDKKGGWCAMCL